MSSFAFQEPPRPTDDFPALVPRRQVRVLFINDTARNGGPGRSLYYILKFLDPAAIRRVVVLPREGIISSMYESSRVADEIHFEPHLVENPIEPWTRPMSREDFSAPKWLQAGRLFGNVARAGFALKRLTELAERLECDLLYCNGTNADFAGGVLARTTGIPALWHVRYTSLPGPTRLVHDRLAASRGVRRILCVSQSAAQLFPHCSEKVRVIHNALDVAEFSTEAISPQLRTELGLPADAVVFGSQGRILPRKGYREMISAAKRALSLASEDERRRMRFVVLGDTPEDIHPDHLAECRAAVRELGLEEVFHFIGFRDDVKPYVSDFDVAVVPSVYPDPLPRSVIESMAMGKPVVAFDVGGVSEMLRDGEVGALVRGTPPDVAGLADQFLRYLRDPGLRNRQGRAARERVVRAFDSRAHAREIQNEIVTTSGLR